MRGKRWLLAMCLLPFLNIPCLAYGQSSLTPEQQAIYRNDVLTVHQAEFSAMVANSDWSAITISYNSLQSPDYYVWKTALTRREIYQGKVVDAPPSQTTWNWTTFKGQSVQERDSWEEMLRDGIIDPSLDNVRANYNNIFGGQGVSAAQQQFLLALSRRKALRIEVLFLVTASGTGAPATPSVLGREGTISVTDTIYALTGGQ